MTKLLFIFCFALITTQAWAKPGFYSPQDALIPEPVRQAAHSVLRGFVFSGEPQLVLKPEQYGAAIEYFENLKIESSDPIKQGLGKLQATLVKLCASYKLPSCRAGFSQVEMGSFFPIGDNLTLMTAKHVIDKSLRQSDDFQKAYCDSYKSSLMILLIDHEGTVVFESVNGTDTVALSALGSDHLIRASDNMPALNGLGKPLARFADRALNDLAVLKLSKGLDVPPLQWALDEKSATAYFAVGYPQITQGRSVGLQLRDSDGKSQYITVGVKAPKQLPSNVKIQGERPSHFDDLFSRYMDDLDALILRLDNDGNHGLSGGPVTDETGKVLGVVSEGHTSGNALSAPVEQLWAISHQAVQSLQEVIDANLASVCPQSK